MNATAAIAPRPVPEPTGALSSITVVSNANRLRHYQPRKAGA